MNLQKVLPGILERFKMSFWTHYENPTKPVFTCSKLTKETLEQGKKYVQSWQWRHQDDAVGIVLVPLLLTLSTASIVNFEHVIASWKTIKIPFFLSTTSNSKRCTLLLKETISDNCKPFHNDEKNFIWP